MTKEKINKVNKERIKLWDQGTQNNGTHSKNKEKGETQTINTQGNKARPRPISALMCKEEHRHTVRGLQNDRQWATHENVSKQTVGN